MSRKGNCYDNSIMETFFGRMKTEIYYGCEKDYLSFEMFSKVVDEHIDCYNNKRIQSKTKWMPPVQYRITSTCPNYIYIKNLGYTSAVLFINCFLFLLIRLVIKD